MGDSIYKEVQTTIQSKVTGIRYLTEHAFVIRLQRKSMHFTAGQYIIVGINGDYNTREYSIYSSEKDDFLEILVKEVGDGFLSKKLKSVKINDRLEINGPFGYFILNKNDFEKKYYVFIATGTGISPFHSMIKSYENAGLKYTLIHGVKYGNEGYESDTYANGKYILCTSRDKNGLFHGRVTEYLKQKNFNENTEFLLCGNSNMIMEAAEILKDKGFGRDKMHAEIYF